MSRKNSSRPPPIVEITHRELYSFICGASQGVGSLEVFDWLYPRLHRLQNIARPFGTPSDTSKKQVQTGSATLPDGSNVAIEPPEQRCILAISDALQMDEVEATSLMKSFLYNESLPSHLDLETSPTEEIVDAFTPFYFDEELAVYRMLGTILCASSSAASAANDMATECLSAIVDEPRPFAQRLIDHYVHLTTEAPPAYAQHNSRATARWVKHNARMQLAVLELLFWKLWNYQLCDGPLVVRLYEIAYKSQLGTIQDRPVTLLLDDEGLQLQRDTATVWILITVSVLELERVGTPGEVKLSATKNERFYFGDPDCLRTIHRLVASNANHVFACTYMAWTFVVSQVVEVARERENIPASYKPFFETIKAEGRADRTATKPDDVVQLMAWSAMGPEIDLLGAMHSLLIETPMFVAREAWRLGTSLADPNAIAYRSVMKGLLMAMVELVPVEMFSDFGALLNVWVTLFGRSQDTAVSSIAIQFWDCEWKNKYRRRAIFDVARSRFPIQPQLLVQLLRSMTGYGFVETDELLVSGATRTRDGSSNDRATCTRNVFFYLNKLSTFTQEIPHSAYVGPRALFERASTRSGPSKSRMPANKFTSLYPIRFPGGSLLPKRAPGRVLSELPNGSLIVSWRHDHCGWRFICEILTDYLDREHIPFTHHDPTEYKPAEVRLTLQQIGVGLDAENSNALTIECLNLVRTTIEDEPDIADQLMSATIDGPTPDILQLTTLILADALEKSAARPKAPPRAELITSTLRVLASLLPLPKYSHRIWLFLRSTAALFGSERDAGYAAPILATERVSGRYPMTIAFLNLVQRLLQEASASVLTVAYQQDRLQDIKEDVLMRAARFVHSDVWVEYNGWKYVDVADRFEIGRKIASFYAQALEHSAVSAEDTPLLRLRGAIMDAFMHRSTMSTVNPLILSVAASRSVLSQFSSIRRYAEVTRLVSFIEAHLRLIRFLLNSKQATGPYSGQSLLEQALCGRIKMGVPSTNAQKGSTDPVDVLVDYVQDSTLESTIRLEATRVLYAICLSLTSSGSSSPTLAGYMSDPEAAVSALVRLAQQAGGDRSLRSVVWNFISLAVDKEPALAALLVSGRFYIPDVKGKGKAKDGAAGSQSSTKGNHVNALAAARDLLKRWKELWEEESQSLASVMRFLNVVWEHGLEHKASLQPIRQDNAFWEQVVGIAGLDTGPTDGYDTQVIVTFEGERRSEHHEFSSQSAYRKLAKAHALQIIALDTELYYHSDGESSARPASYRAAEQLLKNQIQAIILITDASTNLYDPELYDKLTALARSHFPSLSLEHLRSHDALVEREMGDNFMFSTSLLHARLQSYRAMEEKNSAAADELEKRVLSINLNLSLSYAQTALTKAWQLLLRRVTPFLRGEAIVRKTFLTAAASLALSLGTEDRTGEAMTAIYGELLGLLLSLIEVIWFSTADTEGEINSFVSFAESVRRIIISEFHPPAKSFLGTTTAPFHRTLLQVLYFFARYSRDLVRKPGALSPFQSHRIMAATEATQTLVIDALRVFFELAQGTRDAELDKDLELLVAVFEQCTHREISPSSAMWLARCHSVDLIRASLELFVKLDMTGFSDLALLQTKKHPLYVRHVLNFHVALASIPTAAERLGSQGVLLAYANCQLTPLLMNGQVDVTMPDLAGEHNPAHRSYCVMLSVVSGVVGALRKQSHFLPSQASSFVQLYSNQIARVLSWTTRESLSLPMIEEMEQTTNLFFAIASSVPQVAGESQHNVKRVLQDFSTTSLSLLQQLNYVLTHPNHLASLLEPITAEEREKIEKEAKNLSSQQSADLMDLRQRPFLTSVVHKLFGITSSILMTLIALSKADIVLTRELEEWPLDEALVYPNSKVVLGQRASMGTLLELGGCALDALRLLAGRPAGQAIASTSTQSTHGRPLDVHDAVRVTRRCMEEVLLYAVTQLAMWLCKPELEPVPQEKVISEDVVVPMSESRLGIRPPETEDRKPVAVSQSGPRRVATGEIGADLKDLLTKAKSVIPKTDEILGTRNVDLTQVLSDFLHSRVIVNV